MISKKLEVPLFPGYLIMIISNDSEECCKKYPRLRKHIQDKILYGHTIWSSHKGRLSNGNIGNLTTFFIILNPDNEAADVTTGVLAHEATHFSQMVLNNIGEDNAWETQAYLVQWAVDNLVKFIKDGYEERKN